MDALFAAESEWTRPIARPAACTTPVESHVRHLGEGQGGRTAVCHGAACSGVDDKRLHVLPSHAIAAATTSKSPRAEQMYLHVGHRRRQGGNPPPNWAAVRAKLESIRERTFEIADSAGKRAGAIRGRRAELGPPCPKIVDHAQRTRPRSPTFALPSGRKLTAFEQAHDGAHSTRGRLHDGHGWLTTTSPSKGDHPGGLAADTAEGSRKRLTFAEGGGKRRRRIFWKYCSEAPGPSMPQRFTECAFWMAFWGQVVRGPRNSNGLNVWVHRGVHASVRRAALPKHWAGKWSAMAAGRCAITCWRSVGEPSSTDLPQGAVTSPSDWPGRMQVEQLRLAVGTYFVNGGRREWRAGGLPG